MPSPINEEHESLKVIVIDYCATGEGRHIFIKTATEASVKREVGDWFYQGANAYTVKQWIELDKFPESSTYQESNIETLKTFAPTLWVAMNEDVSMFVDIEYSWSHS